ncbi:hypothetical protein WN944_006974 [Citrus x changshan-huyou]|uniref:Uncharacterized protein n=1 Tax=Citrus x changshan-huyou TaxID=2935761 RepID=A0AAP0MPY9_9ROSI
MAKRRRNEMGMKLRRRRNHDSPTDMKPATSCGPQSTDQRRQRWWMIMAVMFSTLESSTNGDGKRRRQKATIKVKFDNNLSGSNTNRHHIVCSLLVILMTLSSSSAFPPANELRPETFAYSSNQLLTPQFPDLRRSIYLLLVAKGQKETDEIEV